MPKFKEDINWDAIMNAIESNSCMLFLGPEAVTLSDGKPIYRAALEHIRDKNSKDITFYQGEEFLYFHRNITRTAYSEIGKFYNQQKTPAIFQTLADIPFYFILNASPDNYLKQIFEQKKDFKFHFSHYQVEEVQKEINDINKETPLLYNIFGTIEKPSSLIFTHDDLFKFLFSIIGKGNFKIHETVMSQFHNASFLVFLGFKFEKWYVRLLLRLLGIHESETEKSAMGFHQHNDNGEIENFFNQNFNVEFIESNIPEFIEDLHQRCGNRDLLRNFDKNSFYKEKLVNIKRELINMIDEIEMAKFFEEVDNLSLNSEEKTKLNILKQEFTGGQSKHDIYYHNRLKVFVQELNSSPNNF